MTASIDGSTPGDGVRTTTIGCINVDLTTAGEDLGSTDAIALVNALTSGDSSIRIELPSGWSILGHAAAATSSRSRST